MAWSRLYCFLEQPLSRTRGAHPRAIRSRRTGKKHAVDNALLLYWLSIYLRNAANELLCQQMVGLSNVLSTLIRQCPNFRKSNGACYGRCSRLCWRPFACLFYQSCGHCLSGPPTLKCRGQSERINHQWTRWFAHCPVNVSGSMRHDWHICANSSRRSNPSHSSSYP
jgi:hypothetical protein